jgi:hypothetical protein
VELQFDDFLAGCEAVFAAYADAPPSNHISGAGGATVYHFVFSMTATGTTHNRSWIRFRRIIAEFGVRVNTTPI